MTILKSIRATPDSIVLKLEKSSGELHLASIGNTYNFTTMIACINASLVVIGESPMSAADIAAAESAYKTL